MFNFKPMGWNAAGASVSRSKSKRPATAGAVRVVDVPKKTSIPEVRNESMERHAAAALARESAANKPLPEPIYYTPGEAHESRVPAGLDPSKNGPGAREPPAHAPLDTARVETNPRSWSLGHCAITWSVASRIYGARK